MRKFVITGSFLMALGALLIGFAPELPPPYDLYSKVAGAILQAVSVILVANGIIPALNKLKL